MKLTATFSNGYTDAYNGQRDVKAAWMITSRSTGEVLASGHSLDLVKARKTAEGKVNELGFAETRDMPGFYLPAAANRLYGESAKYLVKQVRESGLADDIPVGKLKVTEAFRRAKAANAARNAKKRELVNIEVVAL